MTVVVVDVIPLNAATDYVPSAKYVGSAANEVVIDDRKGAKLLRLFNPRALTDLLGHGDETSEFKPESDEYLDYILSQTRDKIRNHRRRQWVMVAGLVLAALALIWGAYAYTQTRYYVGPYKGQVAIFQGIKESLGPVSFHHLAEVTNIKLADLTPYQRSMIRQTVIATDYKDALREVATLATLGGK